MAKTSYLPDPFLREDATRVTHPEGWPEQAAYIRRLAQEHLYGPWPGHPSSVKATIKETVPVYDGHAMHECISLYVNDEFELYLELIRPAHGDRFPVITYNATRGMAFHCPVEEQAVVEGGYGIASFDREMIAPDFDLAKMFGRLEEAQSRHYPSLSCGDIMAWAWGHTIVADYLQTRGDAAELICTGHSRGGKSALCAGIFDARFAVVAPIGSGCGGAGSARFLGTTDGSRQDETRCETIGSITQMFPSWFCRKYADYGVPTGSHPLGDVVTAFPLDSHMLRAACAPRAVFSSEGMEDYWCNAFGTQLGRDAAQPVFSMLGVPEYNAFHMREGGHAFNAHDWMALLDFCDMVLGRPRCMPHEDTNARWFDIDLKDYASWA